MLRDKILKEFDRIEAYAQDNQVCKRKAVGCSAGLIVKATTVRRPFYILEFQSLVTVHNGPTGKHECTNEVGNCGCGHSEPRAIISMLRRGFNSHVIMVCTYSPCTNCANIILDSGIVQALFYDILTQHDKRGDEFLRKNITVYSREELENLTDDQARQWTYNS